MAIGSPVNFDGTNDWIDRGAGLTDAVDSPNATISFWYRMTALGAVRQLVHGQASRINVLMNAFNELRVQFRTSAAVNTIDVLFPVASDTDWHHVMASTDGTTGHAYFDGTSATATVTGGTIDWTLTNVSVGGSVTGTSLHNGDLAEFWLDNSYLDLSQASNRAKFLLSGDPVDLGSTGATPTGSAPLMFFSGATESWHTNKGTGGGFTLHGALTTGTVPLPGGAPVTITATVSLDAVARRQSILASATLTAATAAPNYAQTSFRIYNDDGVGV